MRRLIRRAGTYFWSLKFDILVKSRARPRGFYSTNRIYGRRLKRRHKPPPVRALPESLRSLNLLSITGAGTGYDDMSNEDALFAKWYVRSGGASGKILRKWWCEQYVR